MAARRGPVEVVVVNSREAVRLSLGVAACVVLVVVLVDIGSNLPLYWRVLPPWVWFLVIPAPVGWFAFMRACLTDLRLSGPARSPSSRWKEIVWTLVVGAVGVAVSLLKVEIRGPMGVLYLGGVWLLTGGVPVWLYRRWRAWRDLAEKP